MSIIQDENRRFYVYIHYKADTMEPFYVGKGRRERANTSWGHSEYWERTVAKHGKIVENFKE